MSLLRTPRHLSPRLRSLHTPLHQQRSISHTPFTRSAWSSMPSPPRLPKEDQETFERLQQQSSGAFSQPRSNDSATDMSPPSGNRMAVNQSPASSSSSGGEESEEAVNARVNAQGKGEELHPNIRRGAPPEFQGETNPKTGEVGGPKNEPLRWGHGGDWSYNGRVTDF